MRSSRRGATGRVRTLTRGLVAFGVLTAFSLAATSAQAASGHPRVSTIVRSHDTGTSTGATTPTNHGSDSRDGWYGDQSQLSPATVADSSQFGQIWKQPAVVGQVYAQPLVADGVLIVATEQDNVYGLNPSTGAIEWSRSVGTPYYEATTWACPDLAPFVGITSTPTFDPTTNSMFFVSMALDDLGAPQYYLHAVNPLDGSERANFPVEIQGQAQNNAGASGLFTAYNVIQRPGLLLLHNSVYIAFGAHCDQDPYTGFIAGVSTAGALQTIWSPVTVDDAEGNSGIWQSGGGLSAYNGDILVTTGNGGDGPNQPTTASAWINKNGSLPESVILLSAANPAALQPVDFFMPYNAKLLTTDDLDFGSGSPVVLPSQFGTTAVPHPVFQDGKSGYVYLLNADALGGYKQGVGNGDAVVGKLGQFGGTWATPAVLPTATGGYIYLPTAYGGAASLGNAGQGNFYAYRVDSTGRTSPQPVMSQVATAGPITLLNGQPSSAQFSFGTSSPVVTSNGLTVGSGVVWIIRTLDLTGNGATLQAYNAVPNGKWLTLLGQWSIGQANKFTPPGVWSNKVFVATKTGTVYGFGVLHAPALVDATPVNFPATIQGHASSLTTTLSAVGVTTTPITITKIVNTSAAFTAVPIINGVATPIPTNGIDLAKGATLKVAITFAPATTGPPGGQLGTIAVFSNVGEFDLPVSGTSQSPTGYLYASTKTVDFNGVTTGKTSAPQAFTLANFGAQSLTWDSVPTSGSPFALSGLPAAQGVLAPDASITVRATFAPTTTGLASRSLNFVAHPTAGGSIQSVSVSLNGSGAAPANLTTSFGPNHETSTSELSFGTVTVGDHADSSVTIANTGGSTVTITNVVTAYPKDPLATDAVHGAFNLQAPPSVGDQIPPGTELSFPVSFQPSAAGIFQQTLELTTDAGVTVALSFTGTGSGDGHALPAPSSSNGWTANGTAVLSDNQISLTPLMEQQVGTSFWPVPQSSSSLSVSYVSTALNGNGADGSDLILANAADTSPNAIGDPGVNLGVNGLDAISVVISEYPEIGAPVGAGINGFIGITNGLAQGGGHMNWLATTNLPDFTGGALDNPLHVTVTVKNGTISVYVNGTNNLVRQDNGTYTPFTYFAPQLASQVLVGFGGSTGQDDDNHLISNVWTTVGGPAPSVTLTPSLPSTFGSVPVGSYRSVPVTFTNNNSWAVTMSSAVASGSGVSLAGVTNGRSGASFGLTALPETIAPGASTTVVLNVQPSSPGVIHGGVTLSALGGAPQSVSFTGTATGKVSALTSATGWKKNGSTSIKASTITLTPNVEYVAGSLWSPTLNRSSNAAVSFTPTVAPGLGADGMAVLVGGPKTSTSFLGSNGWGIGFAPATQPIYAVVFGEYAEAGAPGANFIGISNGGANGKLRWLATAQLPFALGSVASRVTVVTTATSITVYVDGTQLLQRTHLSIAPTSRLGFSGATGGLSDVHAISNVIVTEG